MCINAVEIWFGIAHWQILSIFDRVICPQHDNGGILSFYLNLSGFALIRNSAKPAGAKLDRFDSVMNVFFFKVIMTVFNEMTCKILS